LGQALKARDGKAALAFPFDSDVGYEADDPENVVFVLSFDVRREGEEAGSSFDVTVCTPNHFSGRGPGEKVLLLKFYTYAGLRQEFINRIGSCDAGSAYEAMKKLRRQFQWEYEGMFSEPSLKIVI
jgi:hypothetical protein